MKNEMKLKMRNRNSVLNVCRIGFFSLCFGSMVALLYDKIFAFKIFVAFLLIAVAYMFVLLKTEEISDRLHRAGFKIRILETIDSHFLAEALENHDEIKKGDKFLTLKEHVKEPPK